MSTLDVVAEHGGSASNFLDIGGGAKSETVSAALEVLETDPNVKSVLINIFGGITRCDLVADGIVEATSGKKLKWPIIIRLDGTNSKEGLEILKNNPNDNILNFPIKPNMPIYNWFKSEVKKGKKFASKDDLAGYLSKYYSQKQIEKMSEEEVLQKINDLVEQGAL